MARRKCSVDNKDRFPTRVDCDLAIADIHRSNNHHHRRGDRDEPTRSYRCDHCGDWHMTSQPDRRSLTA